MKLQSNYCMLTSNKPKIIKHKTIMLTLETEVSQNKLKVHLLAFSGAFNHSTQSSSHQQVQEVLKVPR